MKNIVIVPVYKPDIKEAERASLIQCLSVLGSHAICLVGPAGLDLSVYQAIFDRSGKQFRFEAFEPAYFHSVAGYNKLMLSKCFYARFEAWEYMLIYQLDAWVFRDELDAWCAKGYDYIGAPWLRLDRQVDEQNSGNGGFSLRRIASFIALFDHKGAIWGYKGLACRHRYRGPRHKIQLILKGLFGYENRLEDFIEKGDENEDLFFAALKHKKKQPFRIPLTREAMFFSFEEAPAVLYEKTNRRLPFGCHAWQKHDYEKFWKQFIKMV